MIEEGRRQRAIALLILEIDMSNQTSLDFIGSQNYTITEGAIDTFKSKT